MKRFLQHSRPLLMAVSVAALPAAAFGQIVPDGSTSTSVAVGASGRPTVSIAGPSAAGVSVNNYNQFSVMPTGANLDNTSARAGIIVNQVTSSNRSYLYGPLEVLGSRAHVVVANPNGITVNGGSFVNTGGVVLSGGTVRYDGAGAPIVPTGPGDIHVGPGGLSGTMTTLQLAAARLKIDGPIINDHVSPNADISVVAGNAELTLDPNVSPISTLRSLVKERKDLGGASDEYLVDVTPNGYMAASRVKIAVSAKGAGVSFAGTGQSTIGAFTIDASGKISARGARITSESGVKLSGGSVEILNSPAVQSQITANSGPVTVLARSGNIDITGVLTGETIGAEDLDAKGAVTLTAAADINILTENADRLAIVYGARGDVSLQAGGTISNRDGRILSNNNIAIKAGGQFKNTTTIINAVNGGEPITTMTRRRYWLSWLFGKKKRIVTTFDYGRTFLPNDRALVFGSSVSLEADELINSGEISAATGSLAIKARSVTNEALWTGTISLVRQCGLICWSKGTTDIMIIGGIMNAQFGLSINASERLLNNGGQIISYGDIEINAPSVETYAAFVPTIINNPAGMGNFWAGTKAWISWQPTGGYLYAPIGALTINSDTPVISDGGLVQGGSSTTLSAGLNELRALQNYGPFPANPIGLLQGILP